MRNKLALLLIFLGSLTYSGMIFGADAPKSQNGAGTSIKQSLRQAGNHKILSAEHLEKTLMQEEAQKWINGEKVWKYVSSDQSATDIYHAWRDNNCTFFKAAQHIGTSDDVDTLRKLFEQNKSLIEQDLARQDVFFERRIPMPLEAACFKLTLHFIVTGKSKCFQFLIEESLIGLNDNLDYVKTAMNTLKNDTTYMFLDLSYQDISKWRSMPQDEQGEIINYWLKNSCRSQDCLSK